MNDFQGLPPGLFGFFTDLDADSTKTFWQVNKPRWEHDVRTPMRSLLAVITRVRMRRRSGHRITHGISTTGVSFRSRLHRRQKSAAQNARRVPCDLRELGIGN